MIKADPDVEAACVELARRARMGEPMKLIAVTGIEARVCEEIGRRQAYGLKKYGVSLEDNPLTRRERLQHAKEEALDLAMYLQAEIEAIDAVAPAAKIATKTASFSSVVETKKAEPAHIGYYRTMLAAEDSEGGEI